MKLPKGFNLKVPVKFEFQLETIINGIVNPNHALLLHMGLGKTYCAINIARYNIQFNKVNKVLVVAPATLLINWREAIHSFSEYKAIVLHGTSRTERRAKINKFINKNYHFGIINYEALKLYFDDIRAINYQHIIFDESARYIKSIGADRTKAAIMLADKAEYHNILTGTLFSNNPLSVWSQFRVLDKGKTFGTNFYAFRNTWFTKQDFGLYTKYTLKQNVYNVFRSKIESMSTIKTRKELNLNEPLFSKIVLEPSDDFYKEYDKLSHSIETEISTMSGNITLNINNMLTKLMKLQQFTSGIMIDNDRKEHILKWRDKLDAVLEYVETVIDNGESIVIVTRFRKSNERICEELKKKNIKYLSMIGGGKDNKTVWKEYQRSKDIPVFVVQIESGGIGIELFKIDSTAKFQHMAFMENHPSLDFREQVMPRIDRIGQLSTCIFTDFVVKNTYDTKLLKALIEKKKISDIILNDGVKTLLAKED